MKNEAYWHRLSIDADSHNRVAPIDTAHPDSVGGDAQPDTAALRRWLLACAVRLQSRREHSRQELQQKVTAALYRRGWVDNENLLADVLNTLEAKHWLCDVRAAESVVHNRQQQWGVRRIAQTLKDRGVSDAVMEEAIQNLAETEYERAFAVWRKKYAGKAAAGDDFKARARQMRFLAGRGFGSEVVRKVVETANREEEI